MTPLATLVLGFFLGLQHACDSDHLVAVSTVVTRERSVWRSLWVGLWWGVGHTVTLLIVGLIVLGLKAQIPTPVELSLECLVGVVLVGLGLTTLYDCWQKRVHIHSHAHADTVHAHFHTHADDPQHHHAHAFRPGMKPLLIGMIHGLAGSAALMLFVLATIPSVGLGLFYISLFGCGSILGMGIVSVLVGLFFSVARDRLHPLNQGFRLAVGSLSTVFGAWIVIEIGFVEGLFFG
jgi:ABC-type nickel/cobalt efflux system permease component RcnA